jgi:hypothetical protein
MRKFLCLFAASAVLVVPHGVRAQGLSNAVVVSTCGTQNYAVGYPAPLTVLATGPLCDGASGTGGGPVGYNPADASGTIATGGSFQQVFAANSSRVGCWIQNPATATEVLKVYFQQGTATLAKATDLSPGAGFNCQFGGAVVTGAISVEAATTTHAFVAAGS